MRRSPLYGAVDHVIYALADLALSSAYLQDTGSEVALFANRFSGALADGKLLARLRTALDAACPAPPRPPAPGRKAPDPLVLAPERREEIPEALVRLAGHLEERLSVGGARVLLVSVGGDGTHKSVLSALVALPQELRKRVAVFRFPAGSSNDGSASRDPGEAARRLLQGRSVSSLKALEIETAAGSRELGFNIVSFGIDAYTTIKNEQFRALFGGNSYRGLANAAVLFFEALHNPGLLSLEMETATGEARVLQERLILIALGVSGGRSYGGGIPVLPGPENLCYVGHLNLFGKLMLKGRLLSGTHLGHPKVHAHRVSRMILSCERRLPMQIDGEARWLLPEEFPVSLHLGREHILELL